MPGRSSSSRSPSRSSSHSLSTSSYKRSYSPPKSLTHSPKPTQSVVTHSHQVEKPGFFSNMWTGFGLGTGQAIAHNIFRSEPQSNTPPPVYTPPQSTLNLPKEYIQCMKDNNNDKELCKQFLE